LGIIDAVTVLVPAFLEGGRVTIDDVHYIREQDELVPVAETPFAQDTIFGYTHSNLKEWVEEKTRGAVKAEDVVSISLKDLRLRGPEAVAEQLSACRGGDVCIVNACSHKDLEVLAMALLLAEKRGKKFLYRTSATFVPIRAGIEPGKLYRPKPGEAQSDNGSLVVVGSYVPKTTLQLAFLLEQGNHRSIEIDVPELLRSTDTTAYRILIVKQASDLISRGRNVVIHTSRRLETGKDAESTLLIHRAVSAFLVGIVRELRLRPAFIIGKGGITSSDLATKALSVTRATILGQVIAGVPVWKLDNGSRFPDMLFVVFPGNVGDNHALADVCDLLRAPNGESSRSMQTKPKT
jgi:uncharacterized protein YgbK (DUF1537 family)